MNVSQVTNSLVQQFLALSPLGSISAPNSPVTSNATQGVQGHHHHHHRRSMADQVSKMGAAIDDAVKAGKLTSDQATQMKKELDSITQALNNNQTGSGAQPTSNNLQQIKAKFQDVRKQLFDALNPQGSTSASNDTASRLFQMMDTNGNGVIDQNEFLTFINQMV